MLVFISGEFRKNLANLSRQFTASANRCYKFHKCSQLFIRVHNEALTVAAMRVTNEDRSPAGIHSLYTAQLQPVLLRLSAMISQYFTRWIVPLLLLQGGGRMIAMHYIRRNILRFGPAS